MDNVDLLLRQDLEKGRKLAKLFVDKIDLLIRDELNKKLTLKLNLNGDDDMTNDLNLSGHLVSEVGFPQDDFDVINKCYLQISKQVDEIEVTDLNNLAELISKLLEKYKDIDVIKKYSGQFKSAYNYVQVLLQKYHELFKDKELKEIAPDLNFCPLFTDLKVSIIKIFEILPEYIFIELKKKMQNEELIKMPEEKTIRKKYRRFLNKLAAGYDPARSNPYFELLIQKNLLLIDFGFIYFIEYLLKRMLIPE
jgi:hypothetical protein